MKGSVRVIAFGLALLTLVSSSRFSINLHHCGGQLAGVALLHEAPVCAMESQTPPCHRIAANGCCHDSRILHDANPTAPIASAPELGQLNWDAVTTSHTDIAQPEPSVLHPESHDFYGDPPNPARVFLLTRRLLL